MNTDQPTPREEIICPKCDCPYNECDCFVAAMHSPIEQANKVADTISSALFPASQPEPAKCSTCGKIDNQFCSNPFHLEQNLNVFGEIPKPEPAKDEFKLLGGRRTDYVPLNQPYVAIECDPNTFARIFGQNKEATAKQIVEAVKDHWKIPVLIENEKGFERRVADLVIERNKLRAKLEQARAKIGEQEETLSELQDTFRKMTDNSFKQGELIGQLRAKVEGLEKYAAHKPDCQYYQTYIGGTGIKFHKECTCGLSALLEDKSDRTG